MRLTLLAGTDSLGNAYVQGMVAGDEVLVVGQLRHAQDVRTQAPSLNQLDRPGDPIDQHLHADPSEDQAHDPRDDAKSVLAQETFVRAINITT